LTLHLRLATLGLWCRDMGALASVAASTREKGADKRAHGAHSPHSIAHAADAPQHFKGLLPALPSDIPVHGLAHNAPSAPQALERPFVLRRKRATDSADSFPAEGYAAREHAMRAPAPALGLAHSAGGPVLRRKCACEGSGKPCESCEAEKKNKLMRKAANAPAPVSTPARSGNVSPMVDKVLHSPGHALEAGARSYFEPRFGSDLSRVRVHTDAEAAESARAVDAHAYTVGSHIVFGKGLYQPGTSSGRHLLAHELAHTMQSPETGGILRPLSIAPVDDPSERAADHAASAVMSGESTSLAPQSGSVLRRQFAARRCTATAPTANKPNESDVNCSDGAKYHVTLTLSPNPPSPDTQTTVNAGFGDNRLFVEIDICRGGTEVILKPNTGDLSDPVAKAVGNIIAGSSALSGVVANPGITFTIGQSKSFTVTVDPTVSVGQQGVTGGGGQINIETKNVTISLGGHYDVPTKAFTITFGVSGGKPQKDISCTKDSDPTLVFNCEKLTPTTIPAVEEKSQTDEEVRYLFFQYPTAKIRQDFRLPSADDLNKLASDGFKVDAIDGYTSPEGPKDKRHMPQFEGNDLLGQERADAARDWLKVNFPEFDLTAVTPKGHSELPPDVGGDPNDPEGPKMEKAAVSEFLGESASMKPDPLAPKTPAEVAAFKKLPQSKQRDKAFELMRRAVIHFSRKRITQKAEPAKPGPDKSAPVACARDVTDAARRVFDINIINSGPKVQ